MKINLYPLGAASAAILLIEPVSAGNFEVDSIRFQAVPEPGSALLSGLAAGLLLLRRRR